MSRNFLSKNNELRKGDFLISNNGKWKAIFQDDGDFVIFTCDKVVWSSGTNGSDGFRLCMQGNCNLVMYDSNDSPRWTTQSGKLEANMCRLQLTDDGNLELYREAAEIWSSVRCNGVKL